MPVIPLARESRPLTDAARQRYRRNIDVPGLGEEGQARLLAARVCVVGAGGLGSAVLPYLVGAGVGEITIVDGDDVEAMNLQRQVLHRDVGRNKAESAAEMLRGLNPDVTLVPVPRFLSPDDAPRLFAGVDLVLDCTDTFGAKLMLSDAAQAARCALVWASAVGMQGQCSVFGVPDAGGNVLWLRDLHPAEPSAETYPNARGIGILGSTVGQVGTVQAGETIKLITGIGEPLVGRIWVLDAARGRYDVIPLKKVGV